MKLWRLAWTEPRRKVSVFYPAPLHWLARAIHEAAWRTKNLWRMPTRESHEAWMIAQRKRETNKLAQEYARGYMTGWQECADAIERAMEEEKASREGRGGSVH